MLTQFFLLRYDTQNWMIAQITESYPESLVISASVCCSHKLDCVMSQCKCVCVWRGKIIFPDQRSLYFLQTIIMPGQQS